MAATSCGILGSKTHEPAIVKLKRWQTSCGIFSQETHEAAILKVYGGHDILWNTQSKNTRTSYSKTSRWHDILWNIQSRNPWTSYIKTVRCHEILWNIQSRNTWTSFTEMCGQAFGSASVFSSSLDSWCLLLRKISRSTSLSSLEQGGHDLCTTPEVRDSVTCALAKNVIYRQRCCTNTTWKPMKKKENTGSKKKGRWGGRGGRD